MRIAAAAPLLGAAGRDRHSTEPLSLPPPQGKDPYQRGSPRSGKGPTRLAYHQEIGQAFVPLDDTHHPTGGSKGTPPPT